MVFSRGFIGVWRGLQGSGLPWIGEKGMDGMDIQVEEHMEFGREMGASRNTDVHVCIYIYGSPRPPRSTPKLF